MKSKSKNSLIASVIAVIVILAACFSIAGEVKMLKDNGSELQAVRSAVYQRAMQCYIIEGAYPESLDYLIDNYGLAVNTDDYRVVYVPYAENLPPEIKVIPR